MNKFKSLVVATGCLTLIACASSPSIDKSKVFSQGQLTDEEIHSQIIGNNFSAQVRTGRHKGWYRVNIRSNGELVIDEGRFTRRWVVDNKQLCITPCFKFYKNPEMDNQYFAVIDDEIDVLLKRR